MTGLDIVRAALVAMGADGLVSQHRGYDYECYCNTSSIGLLRAGGRCCLVKCVPARRVECAADCQCGYPEQGHLVPMEDARNERRDSAHGSSAKGCAVSESVHDVLFRAMRERLRERADTYGHGSAYADLKAICAALDMRLTDALRERNDAREKLAKVRQELAATVECDCGTCLACRVADVVGV